MSILLFHPHPPQNPYQEMLYERCPDSGIELRSLRDLSGLDDGSAPGEGVLLHLHWTHTILREERNSVAAELKDPVFGAAALDRAHAYPPEAMAADFVALAESVLAEES